MYTAFCIIKELYISIRLTEKAINDILTKTDWKDDGVRKTCNNIRQYKHALGYSEEWMNDYVYNIVLLAKKEPKPKA